MFTATKHKVRARSASFSGKKEGFLNSISVSVMYFRGCDIWPSRPIKGPRRAKEHRSGNFLWKYLMGHRGCAGCIKFSYCKNWCGLLGFKVKANYVEPDSEFHQEATCRYSHVRSRATHYNRINLLSSWVHAKKNSNTTAAMCGFK